MRPRTDVPELKQRIWIFIRMARRWIFYVQDNHYRGRSSKRCADQLGFMAGVNASWVFPDKSPRVIELRPWDDFAKALAQAWLMKGCGETPEGVTIGFEWVI
jgi:hypothetical protein